MIDVLNKKKRLYFSGYGFSTSCSDSGRFRKLQCKNKAPPLDTVSYTESKEVLIL
jgi:hypothetical protein